MCYLFIRSFITLTILLLSTSLISAQSVGKVEFPISCEDASKQVFKQALALTHNMMYVQAEQKFFDITQSDPIVQWLIGVLR